MEIQAGHARGSRIHGRAGREHRRKLQERTAQSSRIACMGLPASADTAAHRNVAPVSQNALRTPIYGHRSTYTDLRAPCCGSAKICRPLRAEGTLEKPELSK